MPTVPGLLLKPIFRIAAVSARDGRSESETQRHAGHADIVRDLVDGSVGPLREAGDLPSGDPAWWRDYHAQVE